MGKKPSILTLEELWALEDQFGATLGRAICGEPANGKAASSSGAEKRKSVAQKKRSDSPKILLFEKKAKIFARQKSGKSKSAKTLAKVAVPAS